MKRFPILMLLAMPLFTTSCSEDEELVSDQVAVTNHNLSGTWSAQTWRGQAMPEGAYVKITFVRSDKTFTIRQNVGSMYEQTFSGTYSLRQDDDTEQWILSGMYDYDGGPWAHDYYVSSLTATTLTLTATSDASDVTIYQKEQ